MCEICVTFQLLVLPKIETMPGGCVAFAALQTPYVSWLKGDLDTSHFCGRCVFSRNGGLLIVFGFLMGCLLGA